jgi:hypothetical protein
MKKELLVLVLAAAVFFTVLNAEVVNPGKPLKGAWDLKAEKIWEIATYGKKQAAMPAVGAILEDGTLTLFDYKFRENYIFGADGKFIASFGKRGEGPGEVKSQRRVFAGSDGFIVVDYFKLHYFSKQGKHLKTIPFTRAQGFPEKMIHDSQYISFTHRGAFKINWVDLKENKRRTITEKTAPGEENVNFSAAGGRMVTIVIPPLTPRTFCDFDVENRLFYFGKNDAYEIDVMDETGGISNRFSLKRPKVKLTKAMKKAINKEMRMSKKMWERFPKELTYFSEITLVKGNVFVFATIFDEYFKAQHIDVFSLKGEYVYRIDFSPGEGELLSGNIRFKGDHIYAVVQDEDGDMKVVKYKVQLP